MPSPAALAKYVMAFVVAAPFNPEGMDTLPDRGGINYQVNHGGRNTAPNHGGMNYEVNHAAINTPAYHTGMQAPIDLRDPYIAGTSGLYLCVDGGFTGYCRYFTAPHGQCTNLDGDLAGKVSAAGPDKGNWCTLYANFGCTGEEYQLHWPGESHLGDRGYGDKAKSYNCAAE